MYGNIVIWITLKHGTDGVELLTLNGLVIMIKNILLS